MSAKPTGRPRWSRSCRANITPAPLAQAAFQGATPDGEAIAFKIDGDLYLRRGGETQEATSEDVHFGGISADGGQVTYLVPNGKPEGTDPPHGDVFSYDAESDEAKAVGSGGKSIIVNVSADGSHVFFLSPLQLVGGEGVPGARNLYAWDAGTDALEFIATVSERDVLGELSDATLTMTDGLGLWVNRVLSPPFKTNTDGPGADPSRATTDGEVFVFESRAQLTAYPNEGQAEIYRYAEGELGCLSCNPTGIPAQGGALLQGPQPLFLDSLPPVNSLVRIANLSADGQAVFFQSPEPLVATDNDGKLDVYEWQAEGKGGCERPQGCLALISSGQSAANEYLYAMTDDGHDVFILTAEPLVGGDPDGGHSIYDARVEGGFAPATPPAAACEATDTCRVPAPAPALPTAASGPPFVEQNVSRVKKPCAKKGRKGRRCAKAKHKKKGKRHSRTKQAPRAQWVKL